MSDDFKSIEKAANELAIELGVSLSFIEKDWYATKVLKAISEFSHTDIIPIFSGGTSLSKGYNLIQRFSEDLDFKIDCKYEPSIPAFKVYRTQILNSIEEIQDIQLKPDSLISRNGSKYFSVLIIYPQRINTASNLRPEIKLEFNFVKPKSKTQERTISSMINSFTSSDAETMLQCVSPIETAADKFSAFIWRVLKRDRNSINDDPTLIRHLYDLFALEAAIKNNKKQWMNLIQEIYPIDFKRGSINKDLIIAAKDTFQKLNDDILYEEEFKKFVFGMSFTNTEVGISFKEALNSFARIIELIEAE